jgi:hypothetical protein
MQILKLNYHSPFEHGKIGHQILKPADQRLSEHQYELEIEVRELYSVPEEMPNGH